MIIYRATNTVNNKVYIGQTINTLEYRKTRHCKGAFNNTQERCSAFWKALCKYGIENFEWSVIAEATTQEELNALEIRFIAEFNCISPNGYNLQAGGHSGLHHESSKRKISEAHKGKVVSIETRQKISDAHKGKKLSEEHKKKISDGNRGKIIPEETLKKMRTAQSKENNPMWGRVLTDEHKQKLSEALTGSKNPFYGRKHSEETKRKISEAQKLRNLQKR